MGWGWGWRDNLSAAGDTVSGNGDGFPGESVGGSAADGQCSTSKVVKSQCKTIEVEPGKFVRKCEKTEEVFRHCLGMPPEVVHSNKEYTEEDVTHQMINRPLLPDRLEEDPLKFPGLRNDIDAIERHLFGGMRSFFDAAEEVANSLFDVVRDHPFQPPTSRGVPVEDHPQTDSYKNDDVAHRRPESGHIDLSSLTRDV